MVATTGAEVVFVAVKAAISPFPLAARPILEVVLVQLYVVVPPVLMVLKVNKLVESPLQITWSVGSLTCAVGFTVMVKLWVGPSQLTEPFEK